MFDRGLISVDDDYSMLIASAGVPDTISRLMNLERRLLVCGRATVFTVPAVSS
jgi:putative restriction endonuclease